MYCKEHSYSTSSSGYSNTTINGVWTTRHKKAWEEYAGLKVPEGLLDGQSVLVVVAVWSTGDSFGYDTDYYAKIVNISETKEESDEHLSKAEAHNDKYSLLYPWGGYFESLSSLTQYKMNVKHVN